METLGEKIWRVTKEKITIEPYDPIWPFMFKDEKEYLLPNLPNDIIKRIEHFGSTAVPGLSAKPIIDMLVEVASLEETKEKIVPFLESQGYDYFWRPSFGDNEPPFYAWFIKRDSKGNRTHHIHMIEKNFEHWDRLYFKNYLIENPEIATEYQGLKLHLSEKCNSDRVEYTKRKTEFIQRITQFAKNHYK